MKRLTEEELESARVKIASMNDVDLFELLVANGIAALVSPLGSPFRQVQEIIADEIDLRVSSNPENWHTIGSDKINRNLLN